MAESGDMYCYIDTPENAQDIARRNGVFTMSRFSNANTKLSVELVSVSDAPADDAISMRLSDFLRDEKNALRTKTVQFRQLPTNNTISNVKEMIEESGLENGEFNDDSNPGVVHIDSNSGSGIALARFSSVSAAMEIVLCYNGYYWKNSTVYLECVPDSEMDVPMDNQQYGGSTSTMFIGAVKPGASKEDIRKLFEPHVPKDINMPPGKRCAFVFLPRNAAEKFMNDFPNGKRYDGWTYRVQFSQKDKKRRERHSSYVSNAPAPAHSVSDTVTLASSVSIATAPAAPIDQGVKDVTAHKKDDKLSTVRLSGFYASTTEQQIHDLCKFNKINPIAIHMGNGQADLLFHMKNQAEDAELFLDQKKIQGQKKKLLAVKLG